MRTKATTQFIITPKRVNEFQCEFDTTRDGKKPTTTQGNALASTRRISRALKLTLEKLSRLENAEDFQITCTFKLFKNKQQ